jgi:outer membrane protein
MKNHNSFFMVIIILIVTTAILHAQSALKIGIIKDASSIEFEQLSRHVKTEVLALTKARFDVTFKEVSADWQPAMVMQNIQKLMNDPGIDLLVALGFISSNGISKLTTFPKPVIAANILDQELQRLPIQSNNSTGVNNFSYIESLIQLKKDMHSFSQMFDIKQLVVLIPQPLKENLPQITQYLNQGAVNFNISIVSVGENSSEVLSQIPPNCEAVFVLPLVQFSRSEIQKLFNGLNKRHIPSLAVSGIDYLTIGATVTLTPQFTFQQLARQVALRVMKISEGINLSEIPVSIEGAQRAPVVNMESIRLVNKFPAWNILNESILINVTCFPGKKINLRMAIAEALENNLRGKTTKQDLALAEKDVRIAKSNIYPHVDVSGSGIQLSENLVESSMGQKGEFTVTGSASLKQVVLSEPVFANIAIKKLAAENMKFYNEQTMLDIVSNVSNAYISLLFAKSNLQIQNENVNATMQNLQLAKVKEEAGQSGISDVNRWTSELNLNKMKLNDAYTLYRTNMYQINSLLNSPIDNSINTPDSNTIDKIIMLNQNILTQFFENPGLTEKYADFIIVEMQSNSPEIQQLLNAVKIIERKKTLYKRQLFLPEVAVFAGVDQVFVRDGAIANPRLSIPPPPDEPSWNVGLSLSIPLFEGGKTVSEVQKSNIELNKIAYQKEELLNVLETGIRSNVQKLRTSYLELELSQNAALAAEDNFKVVQDAYSQGVVNQVQLIDAQNVMTRSKHLSTIAYYQYVLDYIYIERLQGEFTFLNDENEQESYTKRLKDYLTKGK